MANIVEESIPVVMRPTSASEDEVKRYELFSSAASREAYLLNQSALFVLLAQSILMAAFVTNASGGSRFLVCSPAIVGALILITTISTMVSGYGRIESQWRVYLKGIASEGEIIWLRVIGVSCCSVFRTIKTKAFISLSVGTCKCAVKSERCKELHGCVKERVDFPKPNPTPELHVFNHILPQINNGSDEIQLSSLVIVFQLVGWVVVVAALIKYINNEQAIAQSAVDSSFIAGDDMYADVYDIHGNACACGCVTDQGECC
jgi:hypothetical protein